MRHSLKLKITLILCLSMFFLIFTCWMSNEVFLPKYYEKQKVSSLQKDFEKINKLVGRASIDSNYDIIKDIEKLEANSANSIYIIETNEMYGKLGMYFLYPISISLSDNEHKDIFKSDRFGRIVRAIRDYIYNAEEYTDDISDTITHLFTDADKYDIYKLYDNSVDSNYIDLLGFLENGNMVFVRSNYSNISESSVISNRFLAITGLAVLVLGSVVMYLFSRSLTKPILQLSKISTEMSKLNFENRYNGKRRDEIGVLGNSINTLSNQLENTISELKAANNELEKDIKKKEEIDTMRREFLSNVSHELKTPIALIQGYAEGLADNINDDEESRNFYCEVITDEAQKMNKMVKKLLSLNELEFGNAKPDFERFDIVELVKSVSSSIEILAQQNDTRLILNENKSIYVWADQYMIEEVVTNYLSNALNHVDDRKIIDISFAETDNKVRVSVFNTGELIPPEDINNIWDKFYKVDKARTREYGGSGIGLSIVKAILEAHNGTYGVNNHEAGVEFWFELKIG